MPGIKRVELPSGGWWEINTAPKWGAISAIQDQQDDKTLLAAVTNDWSFPEPITPAAIGEREMPDVIAALEVVFEHILPLFERLLQIQRLHSTRLSGTAE